MFFEVIAAIVLGVTFGILTGLIPGLHINLVAVIALAFNPSPEIAAFLVAMSVTHTFVDFIPSIFLGAPSSDTALSVLPGHQLLNAGFGYAAFRITVIGSIAGILLTTLLAPLLYFVIPTIFNATKNYIALLLLFLMLHPIKKLATLYITIAAGALGTIALSSHMQQPLLPLFAGLFGLSTILLSEKQEVPKQTTVIIPIKTHHSILGFLAGSLVSLFPGLGPAQAALLVQFVKKPAIYLLLLGTINTTSMLIALLTALTIDKARNGSIAVLTELIPSTPQTTLTWFAIAMIVTGPATLISLFIAKHTASALEKVSLKYISAAVILFIAAITYLLSGLYGTIVLGTATAIGITAIKLNVPRHVLMAVLMLPITLNLLW